MTWVWVSRHICTWFVHPESLPPASHVPDFPRDAVRFDSLDHYFYKKCLMLKLSANVCFLPVEHGAVK